MDLNQHKKEFDKVVEHFKVEAVSIRTGRAAASLVDEITVEHYGGKYKLKELATISIPEPKTVLIQPWDKNAGDAILKGIKSSNLGINPISDGQGIRLVMPALTEERRKEFIRLLHNKVEEARIKTRQIREDVIKKVQAEVRAKTAREDDMRKAKEELQKIMDDANKKFDELIKKKEQELML